MLRNVPVWVVWGVIAIAGGIAVYILVLLLSAPDPAEDMIAPDGESADSEAPIDLRQLEVLYRIDRKLKAVHLVAILALVGWLITCLVLAVALALGPSVMVTDLLRRLLR